MSITEILSKFVVESNYEELPKNVVDHVKNCILDWIGVALAGTQELSSRIFIQFIKESGGKEESSIIGEGVKTSCVNAAFANGVLGHAVELDDVHETAIIHPAAPVMPAAIAVAERVNATGKDVIASVAVGYETEIRISNALIPSHYKYWHPTGTIGTFGATAAVSKLLKLNENCVAHAFGVAGTEAAGLIEVFGTMSKPFNAGRAARDGVIASLLAQKGFTSSKSMLESEKGYLYATSSGFDTNLITNCLGESYELTNTIFKRHASCGHTHGAIDAVLDIKNQNDVSVDDVKKISVETYPIAVEVVGKNYQPQTAAEAKFSLPYCVATAIVNGKVDIEEFSRTQMSDPTTRELMKKVKIGVAPEYFNSRLGSAKVTLHTRDGKELFKNVETPKGYPKNPLTGSEIEQKFMRLSAFILEEEKINDITDKIKNLEKLENIIDLTDLLRR